MLCIIPEIEHVLLEAERLLLKNRIFLDRTQGDRQSQPRAGDLDWA